MPNRGHDKPPDQAQGVWSWSEISFREKYTETNPLECWIWHGSAGPHGALFGAYKNARPQMTQARRIAWMQHTEQSVEDIALKMTCKNSMCVNPGHMQPGPNQRRKS